MSWVHSTAVGTAMPPPMARRRGPIGLVPSQHVGELDLLARPIGRAAELHALGRLSSTSWLTTVTGMPGIGKSTLVESWVSSLDPADASPTSAAVMADVDLLGVGVVGARSVLTIDSVAAHTLAEIRSTLAPGEHVVTTARVPFGIEGEVVLALGPLPRSEDASDDAAAVVLEAWGGARLAAELSSDDLEAARWLARLSDGWTGVASVLGRRARVLGLRELAGALSSTDEFAAWCRVDPDVDHLVQETIAMFDEQASVCLRVLSEHGPQPIDGLAELSGMRRAEAAFQLVRLLQAGTVVVSSASPREYRVLAPLVGSVAGPAPVRGTTMDAADVTVAAAASMVRDGDTWALEFAGQSTRIRHLKGLDDIARLLAQPHRPIAAIDLADGALLDRRPAPSLDRRAVDELRSRARMLRASLDSLAPVRASEARDRRELALIEDELRRSVGPGGRVRPLGATAHERARKTVSFRVRHAIRQIAEGHPRLGSHLDRTVTTGAFCRYEPDPNVVWVVRA